MAGLEVYKRRLLWQFISIKSLIVIWALFSSYLLEPYNSSSSIILNAEESHHKVDAILKKVLAPFISWDGQHFLSISMNGYRYENQHAFFPLYPLLMRMLGEALHYAAKTWLTLETCAALAGLLITNFAHAATIQILYRLGLDLSENAFFAYVAASLYCLNPAAVILTSVYSEALFALLKMSGLLFFFQKHRLIAAILWSLAGGTRSNGILLAGFFIYEFISSLKFFHPFRSLVRFVRMAILVAISAAGFIGFQYYGYLSFCLQTQSPRSWCQLTVPAIYSFVQEHYWNVGLLRYFTREQIPNFLLASPMILLSVCGIISYCRKNLKTILTLGIKPVSVAKRSPFYSRRLVPLIYLWMIMLLSTVFVAHVQIITRLFTFLPAPYWYMAHIICSRRKDSSFLWAKRLVIWFCGLYGIAYTVLFLNYYPPA